MAVRDVIKANSRAALAQLAEGETWTWAARTSAPGVEPPTWTTPATALQARRADRTKEVTYDSLTSRYVERTTCQVTTFDDADVKNGDQVVGDGLTWAVLAVVATGQGLRRLTLVNDVPYLGAGERGAQP